VVTPAEAIEAIRRTGGARPGYRALHAKGTLYSGTFTATPEAAQLSHAAHLDGRPVPALVRFSNGSGRPEQADNKPGVRGMAVKLSASDGVHTDISAQTARLFVSSTPDGFVELLNAVGSGVAAGYRIATYAAEHREVLRTLRPNAVSTKIPASYATVEYHALHAFRWLAADGSSRFVRYHWIPEAGEQFISFLAARSRGADFLTGELGARLEQGPARFALQAQIAGPGDSTIDPSAPWQSRDLVTVGMLEISGIETERERDGDIVVFDPMRVIDGIEPSDDPVLRFRSYAYSASVKLRTGVDRGRDAPQ
jgi:catalase